MPTDYIKKLSKEGKGSISTLEKKWDDAKAAAAREGKTDDYGYITGIFKKMVGASVRSDVEARLEIACVPPHLVALVNEYNLIRHTGDLAKAVELKKLIDKEISIHDLEPSLVYQQMEFNDRRIAKLIARVEKADLESLQESLSKANERLLAKNKKLASITGDSPEDEHRKDIIRSEIVAMKAEIQALQAKVATEHKRTEATSVGTDHSATDIEGYVNSKSHKFNVPSLEKQVLSRLNRNK